MLSDLSSPTNLDIPIDSCPSSGFRGGFESLQNVYKILETFSNLFLGLELKQPPFFGEKKPVTRSQEAEVNWKKIIIRS